MFFRTGSQKAAPVAQTQAAAAPGFAANAAFDPLAADRARSAANANRPVAAAKPDGEISRRPRGRRPSNGGKGYVAKA